jgi:hypothetical protein
MNQTDTLNPHINRIQQTGLTVGIGGIILAVMGAFMVGPQIFYQAYLIGFIYWVQVALGCIGLLMLHNLTGGGWGFAIKRLLEAGAMTVPFMALLFIPIYFGLDYLYLWTDTPYVAENPLLSHKTPYLNEGFFWSRAIFYFLVWSILAFLLNRWSAKQDKTADPNLTNRLKMLSGPGLVIFVLTCTFASIDWMMSLEPKWFSSIYGAIFIVSQGVSVFALMIILAQRFAKQDSSLAQVANTDKLNDIGNLTLAFVVLWAYMSFAQFLIIWSGNLPEEIEWYFHRLMHGWEWVALVMVLFHFAIPFLLLMVRKLKRTGTALTTIAGILLFARLVELVWQIAPSFHTKALYLHWLYFVAPLAIGGFWFAAFAWQLKRQTSLVPLHDPRLKETVSHHA